MFVEVTSSAFFPALTTLYISLLQQQKQTQRKKREAERKTMKVTIVGIRNKHAKLKELLDDWGKIWVRLSPGLTLVKR
jgi:hypothetical protein